MKEPPWKDHPSSAGVSGRHAGTASREEACVNFCEGDDDIKVSIRHLHQYSQQAYEIDIIFFPILR